VPASFELTPRGSAQAAARYARQQCQQRLQVVTTMRRCERLSPGEAFRPESAGVTYSASSSSYATPRRQLPQASRAIAASIRRPLLPDDERAEKQQAALEAEEQTALALSPSRNEEPHAALSGVQALPSHVKNLWAIYSPQQDLTDEGSHKSLVQFLTGTDEADVDDALEQELRQLRNGEDAIAYFAKHGEESDVQVIYCRRAKVAVGEFRPYDLLVVKDDELGSEYFMISPNGIVHVCPGRPSEHTTLASWMHQTMIFTVLVSMSFFRNYLVGKAYRRWHGEVRYQVYGLRRKRLSRRLFLAKPTFVRALT
ncbi:unnamed protein product, partial [Polarella glacialis]